MRLGVKGLRQAGKIVRGDTRKAEREKEPGQE